MLRMQCPICKKPVEERGWEKPMSTFPFCSDRCRLIDLGRWLSGRYQIHSPSDEADKHAAMHPDPESEDAGDQ